MSKIIQTIRNDGLQIITKKLPYTNRIMISIAAKIGSASDPKETPGLFHFFEHMLFQGTKTRTAEEISTLLDRYSESNNASTGLIFTKYYGLAIKKNWEKLFEIISDIFSNPIFPEKELQKERKVIENEIAMYEDNEQHVVFHNLMKALYRSNPAIINGVGTKEGLEKITRDLLLVAHEYLYAPANTVVVVTGNVDHDDVLKASEQHLQNVKMPAPERQTWSDEAAEPPKTKEVVKTKQELERSLIALGFKLPGGDRKEQLTRKILANLIGDGASSALYKELRQRRSMVYSTNAFIYEERSVYQSFALYAETVQDVNTVKELLLKTAQTCKITEKDFAEIREKMNEEACIACETSKDWNKAINQRVESGRRLEDLENYPKKLAKLLAKITLNDVLEVREQFLTEERMACSIVKGTK